MKQMKAKKSVKSWCFLFAIQQLMFSPNSRLQKAQTELVIKKNQCLNLGIDVDGWNDVKWWIGTIKTEKNVVKAKWTMNEYDNVIYHEKWHSLEKQKQQSVENEWATSEVF